MSKEYPKGPDRLDGFIKVFHEDDEPRLRHFVEYVPEQGWMSVCGRHITLEDMPEETTCFTASTSIFFNALNPCQECMDDEDMPLKLLADEDELETHDTIPSMKLSVSAQLPPTSFPVTINIGKKK